MEIDGRESLCTATRDQNYVLSGVNAIEDGWKGSLTNYVKTDKVCMELMLIRQGPGNFYVLTRIMYRAESHSRETTCNIRHIVYQILKGGVYTTSKTYQYRENRHGDTRNRTVHFGKPVRNSIRLPRGSRSAGRRPTGFQASKFFMAVNFSREGGLIYLVL